MAISSGKNVAVFAANEATYGAPAALAAANFLRVTTVGVTNSQLAAIPSPEKTPGRDKHEVFRGRPTSSLAVSALLRGAPGGTTRPRLDPLIENALGADAVVVNGASVVTGSGNAGRALFVAGATDGMFRPQRGGQASPLIPLSGAAVYESVSYGLGRERKSTTLRYQPLESGDTPPGAPAQLVAGWSVNTLTLNIDGSGSPATLDFDGAAARTYHRGGAGAGNGPAQGGAGPNVTPPTDVSDDQPLSGLIAKVWFQRHNPDQAPEARGAWTELTTAFRTLTVTLNNAITLRMDEAGSQYSRGVIFGDNRMTTLEMSVWAEAANPLWADIREGMNANDPRGYSIFVALGNVEGSRVGFYAPNWKPDLPSGDDADAGIAWTLTGELLSDTYGQPESSWAIGVG